MPDDAHSDAPEAIAPRPTQAVHELPVREKILLAAALFLSHMPSTSRVSSISKANLVFIAWALFPESFGMRRKGLMCDELSLEAPDSNRVQAKLAGKDGVTGLGWLAEIEGKTGTEYALTKAGASKARAIIKEKLGGVPPAPQVELSERILKLLEIEEAFAAMKTPFLKREGLPVHIEPLQGDSSRAEDAPIPKRGPGRPRKYPKPATKETVPPRIPLAQELATSTAPLDPPLPAPPREPISPEDLQMLDRLGNTPIAKRIFSKQPTKEEAVSFLCRFDADANTIPVVKIGHLQNLLDRIGDRITDETHTEIKRSFFAVLATLKVVREYFGPRS